MLTTQSMQVSKTTVSARAYVLAPDVVWVSVQDGTARLLHLGGRFWAVSAMGAQMLREAMAQGPQAAVHQVAAQYDVPVQQVQTDIDRFLRTLEAQGLIHRQCASPRTHRLAGLWPSLLLTPMLTFLRYFMRPTPWAVWVLLALARLSCAVFGWSHSLRVWQRCFPQTTVHASQAEQEEAMRMIDTAVRQAAARHILQVECKERALSCWVLARCAGLPARLVVGIRLFPFTGHCWCECGAWALSDDPDRCTAYRPVVTYA
jgi:hypothetical protein